MYGGHFLGDQWAQALPVDAKGSSCIAEGGWRHGYWILDTGYLDQIGFYEGMLDDLLQFDHGPFVG